MMQLDHVVLEVVDPVRSAAFYFDVLGFAAVRLEEFGVGTVKFPSVRLHASTLIDLFPGAMRRGTEPRNSTTSAASPPPPRTWPL